MNVVELIQTVGFPVVAVLGCAFFIYKIVVRYMDESKERESHLMEQSNKQTEALREVAATIERGNNLNEKLSETNRILVDKIDSSLVGINNNIDKILDKLNQ